MMGANSRIEWTHHTFNPWIGCAKVSLACANCYAEHLMDHRLGRVTWGGERVRTSAANWRQPLRWNAELAAAGARARVFCASLADVFDNQVPAEWRADLFELIRATPQLDWLLLTKRIGNAARMAEAAGGMPANVWLGATVVNQEEADRDVPKLLATPTTKRFLSMEPLLGPVDLTAIAVDGDHELNALQADRWEDEVGNWRGSSEDWEAEFEDWYSRPVTVTGPMHPGLDWIIVGGESGPGARPMHPDWARRLRDQCAAAGVPFLFKQWGEWASAPEILSADGPSFHRWADGVWMQRVGKKVAGRLLDAATHDAVPA